MIYYNSKESYISSKKGFESMKNTKQTNKQIILSLKDKLENEWKDYTYDQMRIAIFNETGIEIYTSNIIQDIKRLGIKISERKRGGKEVNRKLNSVTQTCKTVISFRR